MDEFKVLLCKQTVRVVPRFERTTLVEVRDVPHSKCNEKMLVCSRCFKKRGYACRHIYKLVNRLPAFTVALIRWFDIYAHYYGRNGEMSAQFQSMRDKLDLPGIPITEKELEALNEAYSVGSGDAAKELFLRSLPGKLRLRGFI